jgi:hypothetical protein
VAKARVLKELAGFGEMLLVDQDPARQDADRSFQHAHIAVEHDVRNLGALEQRLDGVDQDRIVCAHQFPQRVSPYSLGRSPGAGCCR